MDNVADSLFAYINPLCECLPVNRTVFPDVPVTVSDSRQDTTWHEHFRKGVKKMAIYTWRGTEYLVTRDWTGNNLHIPMNIVTDAIVRAADEGFDAHEIEASIRDAVTLFGATNAEATGIPF